MSIHGFIDPQALKNFTSENSFAVPRAQKTMSSMTLALAQKVNRVSKQLKEHN